MYSIAYVNAEFREVRRTFDDIDTALEFIKGLEESIEQGECYGYQLTATYKRFFRG